MQRNEDFDVKYEDLVTSTGQSEESSTNENEDLGITEEFENSEDTEELEDNQEDSEEEEESTSEYDEEEEDSEDDETPQKKIPYSRFKEANEDKKYFKQLAEEERQRREAIEKQLEERRSSLEKPVKTPEELEQEEAKRVFLEKVTPVLQEAGFMSIADFEAREQERIRQREVEERVKQIRQRESELNAKLSKVKNMPKADANALIAWGQENNILTDNIEVLYKAKYERQWYSFVTAPKAKPLPISKQTATTNDSLMSLEDAWTKTNAKEFTDLARAHSGKK